MRVCLLIWGFLLAAGPAIAGTRIVGSDLLGPVLTPALQEYAQRHDTVITAEFAGSHAGWRQLQLGRADVALLTFPPGEPLPAAPYVCLPLASHVTMVLVDQTLPLGQLSFARLAGIFGATAGIRTARWGELELAGDWAARPIVPQIPGGDDDLTTALFRHLVLQDGVLQPGITTAPAGPTDPTQSQAPSELGVIVLARQQPPTGSGLKALAIARGDNDVAYAPTPENVDRGDYPLHWRVQVVFRRADAPRLFPLLRHLLGEEIAQGCAAAGLVPPPAGVRQRRIFELEQL